jgi:hypothetical protein
VGRKCARAGREGKDDNRKKKAKERGQRKEGKGREANEKKEGRNEGVRRKNGVVRHELL